MQFGLARWQSLLAGLWAGWLLCVALLATPAPFALLERAEAGRVAARMLTEDAYVSLALGVALLVLERVAARRRAAQASGSEFSAGMVLAGVALFCTLAGYFGVLPLMAVARGGPGVFSFAVLHGVSVGFFVVKLLAVLALAWRATALRPTSS